MRDGFAISCKESSNKMLGCGINDAADALKRIIAADRILVKGDMLIVRASNSKEFTVSIIAHNNYFIVSFDNWHEEFYDLETSMALISEAAIGRVRLRVDRIAEQPWRWTVQRKDLKGSWIDIYSNSIFMLGLRRHTDTIYRQLVTSEA